VGRGLGLMQESPPSGPSEPCVGLDCPFVFLIRLLLLLLLIIMFVLLLLLLLLILPLPHLRRRLCVCACIRLDVLYLSLSLSLTTTSRCLSRSLYLLCASPLECPCQKNRDTCKADSTLRTSRAVPPPQY
jgi:hypothetical protein